MIFRFLLKTQGGPIDMTAKILKMKKCFLYKENAFRNQIKLYYKGKLGENEAVVSVYNEFLNKLLPKKFLLKDLQ